MYINSATSGNRLSAYIVNQSKLRRFFGLPYLFVSYQAVNYQGPYMTTAWFYPTEVFIR